MQKNILMPRGVALWLKINTRLTTNQIAQFCNIEPLTVAALSESTSQSFDPIQDSMQLTIEEIKRGENDRNYKLCATNLLSSTGGRKYVGNFEKSKLPGIILWLIANDKLFNEQRLAKLFSTRLPTLQKLRMTINSKTEPINPIQGGLITLEELDFITDSGTIDKKLPGIIAWFKSSKLDINEVKVAKFFDTSTERVKKLLSDSKSTPIDPISENLITPKQLKKLYE